MNILGIPVDHMLKFDKKKKVDMFCKNAARQLNVLYRFKSIFDLKEMETIYKTFILSNFNYCPVVCRF